ncbi:MAG: TRAP transporter substrate-binding protein [Faecalibacterium sp.]
MKKITRKQFGQVLAVVGASALLSACGGSKDTAGGNASGGAKTFNLKLGHNLAEDHAVHIQLTSFAEEVKSKTSGSVNIQIIPNGTLGSEADMISQIQAGALDMAKVSASTLGNFSEKYNAFSVPYVFDDQAHYYTYMDSASAQTVFESTDDQGFRGLTWLDSGARSFYTKATAIRTPADLKGLKIRTMDSQMAIDMMNCLGGSATVMGYSDIYTGMQQGVIDGAENNVTALRDHGDVAKFYCFDEHTRIPDMVVISSNIWNQFSDEQKAAVTECAKNATDEYKTAWKNFEDEVLAAATAKGVEMIRDVDIAAFQDAVQPIYENLKTSNPTTYAVVEEIRAMA